MWVDDVLRFWFDELKPEDWFRKDELLDARIRERFGALREELLRDPRGIPDTPRGLLAATIVLDQFSRNLFRNSSQAFAADPLALSFARRAIDASYDDALSAREKQFLYMPFMHSESREDQARCVALFAQLGDANSLKYAHEHRAIIERFGRFPHRNAALGRESTNAEIEFMRDHEGF